MLWSGFIEYMFHNVVLNVKVTAYQTWNGLLQYGDKRQAIKVNLSSWTELEVHVYHYLAFLVDFQTMEINLFHFHISKDNRPPPPRG